MSNDNHPQHDHRNNHNSRRPVMAPPRERTAKEKRDADWFHMTPVFARPTAADMQERADQQRDIDQCIEEHCSFDKLRNPRSNLGKEHGRLRKEKLEAEAKNAADTAKAAARKAKRAAGQKAARQRKAAAKKALITGFVQLIKEATDALGPPRSLEEILGPVD